MFPSACFEEAVPAPDVHEWHLNQKPQRYKPDKGPEWDCGTRSLGPDKQVQDKDKAEQKSWEKCCSLYLVSRSRHFQSNGTTHHQRVLPPILTIEGLVYPAGEIAGEDTSKDE